MSQARIPSKLTTGGIPAPISTGAMCGIPGSVPMHPMCQVRPHGHSLLPTPLLLVPSSLATFHPTGPSVSLGHPLVASVSALLPAPSSFLVWSWVGPRPCPLLCGSSSFLVSSASLC